MKKRNIIHSIIFFVLIVIVICLSYLIGVERTENYYSFRNIRRLIDDRVVLLRSIKMGHLDNLEKMYKRELGIFPKYLENSYLRLQKSNRYLPSFIDYKKQLSNTINFLEDYYAISKQDMNEDNQKILARLKQTTEKK